MGAGARARAGAADEDSGEKGTCPHEAREQLDTVHQVVVLCVTCNCVCCLVDIVAGRFLLEVVGIVLLVLSC